MVQTVVNNDMTEVNAKDFAVVDFSATWCGPCKMLAPVLHEIAGEKSDKIAFFNIDVDENAELAQKFMVQSVPTLLFLKKGEVVDKMVGFLPKEQLAAWMDVNMER